jgi:lipopolysaccharide transport protein LptA
MKKAILIFVILFVSVISLAAQGYIGDSKLFVEGNKWTFKNEPKRVVINSNVKAKSPDFLLWSDNLVVFCEKPSDKNENSSQQVTEAQAKGNVIIYFMNGYTAYSDFLEYKKKTKQFILIGNEKIKSINNQVSGCKIIYSIDSKKYTIESCKDQKANGMIIKYIPEFKGES